MVLKKIPNPDEVPPDVRGSSRGLWRWIMKRRERGIPENGIELPAFCDEGCILHDHQS